MADAPSISRQLTEIAQGLTRLAERLRFERNPKAVREIWNEFDKLYDRFADLMDDL